MSFEPPTKRVKTSGDDPSVSDHASVQEVTTLEAAAKDAKRGAFSRQISDASTASSDGEESLASGPSPGALLLQGCCKRPRESTEAVETGAIGVFDWGTWLRETGAQEALPECPEAFEQEGESSMEVQQPKTLREILELPLAAF